MEEAHGEKESKVNTLIVKLSLAVEPVHSIL
jgi:hypothetical protein